MKGEGFPLTEKDLNRFWSKVVKKTDGGCWVWSGATMKAGYGEISLTHGQEKAVVYAHRLSYKIATGNRVPVGMHIDHLCRNRACVNPDHLEVVTRRENILRGESWMAKTARQTHCIHGHEFNEKNTYVNKRGHRYCRQCNCDRQRARNFKTK